MLRYMLDTNIVIYVLKHRPIEVLDKFNQCADEVCISVITLAELNHGAEKSSRVQENLGTVEDFASRVEVLPYDSRCASHFGEIRAKLERQGKTIGINDLHIAAHARSEGMILVTNNQREFDRVSGLQTENWAVKSV